MGDMPMAEDVRGGTSLIRRALRLSIAAVNWYGGGGGASSPTGPPSST